ncbi:DgyrCDS2042 [Dimorphilus gyrociliatus]|uniref:DgyrCDS2042 n=1 Tax=Dimorphilus gyrociliatus TaxID=2664684 RepID=A0A7I8VB18_9ANNE|nr:DgyrCDS2042 [Dimorphilus gyrociliatus]
MALNFLSLLHFTLVIAIAQARTLFLEDVTGAYVAFQTWNPCSNGSLEFEFKTTEKIGLLMYTQTSGRDFIELTIQDGKLVFKIFLESFTSFPYTVKDDRTITDNRFHKINILFARNHLLFKVDDRSIQVLKVESPSEVHPSSKFNRVYFGGLPSSFELKLYKLANIASFFADKLKGTIKNIFFSQCGRLKRAPKITGKHAAKEDEKDFCLVHNPCKNGGRCYSMDNSSLCECKSTRYTGKSCEIGRR